MRREHRGELYRAAVRVDKIPKSLHEARGPFDIAAGYVQRPRFGDERKTVSCRISGAGGALQDGSPVALAHLQHVGEAESLAPFVMQRRPIHDVFAAVVQPTRSHVRRSSRNDQEDGPGKAEEEEEIEEGRRRGGSTSGYNGMSDVPQSGRVKPAVRSAAPSRTYLGRRSTASTRPARHSAQLQRRRSAAAVRL